jgi:hypothetical protein
MRRAIAEARFAAFREATKRAWALENPGEAEDQA